LNRVPIEYSLRGATSVFGNVLSFIKLMADFDATVHKRPTKYELGHRPTNQLESPV